MPKSASSYFQSLTIVHAALLLGQVVAAAVIYFVVNAEREPVMGVAAAGQSWVYLVGGLTIAGVLLSAQVFAGQVKKLRETPAVPAKLAGYRTATITRYALLEVPSLVALVGYFLTNNLLLLIFSGLILLLMITYRPTKERLAMDLELPQNQIDTL